MSTIEEETCVKFQDISSQPSRFKFPYVEFSPRSDKYCYSTLGVVHGGKHELILNGLCRSYGQILHEIAHSLGLMHELMRPDRDSFIKINEENIPEDYRDEFRRIQPQFSKLWDRTFDFQSVTLYDPFAFSKSIKPVWEPLRPIANVPLYSLREKDLSFEDSAAINRLYQCGQHCPKPVRSCQPNEYLSKYCRCENSGAYAFRRCKDDRKYFQYCRTAVRENKCYDETKKAIAFCRRTCGRCFRSGIFGNSKVPLRVCVDLEPILCKKYIPEGYCYFDPWTKINCQRSCDLCPPKHIARRQTANVDAKNYLAAYKKGHCSNRYDDLRCEMFAQRGDCKSNPAFMLNHCAMSCKLCPVRNTEDPFFRKIKEVPCRNYIDDERCDALAREGKCRGMTLKQCLASCGKCGHKKKLSQSATKSKLKSRKQTTQTPPVTTTEPNNMCVDKSELCRWLAENGRCISQANVMKQLCPKSCKFCEEDCADLDPKFMCADVVRRGYCGRPGGYAIRCAYSCGLCVSNNTEEITKFLKHRTRMTRVTSKRTSPSVEGSTEAPRTDAQYEALQEEKFIAKRDSSLENAKSDVKSYQKKPRDQNVTQELAPHAAKCLDTFPPRTCISWAWSGYCRYSHVSKLCPFTCKLCTPTDLLVRIPT
ncbi:unnamed protein product [Calicophoron daubneyi]